MRINIDTKFNIGNIVYVADSYYDYWYISKEMQYISEIKIVFRDDKPIIAYSTKDKDGVQHSYPESYLFDTREKGEVWCSKRNKMSVD